MVVAVQLMIFKPILYRCTIITLLATMKAEGAIRNSSAKRKSHGDPADLMLVTKRLLPMLLCTAVD